MTSEVQLNCNKLNSSFATVDPSNPNAPFLDPKTYIPYEDVNMGELVEALFRGEQPNQLTTPLEGWNNNFLRELGCAAYTVHMKRSDGKRVPMRLCFRLSTKNTRAVLQWSFALAQPRKSLFFMDQNIASEAKNSDLDKYFCTTSYLHNHATAFGLEEVLLWTMEGAFAKTCPCLTHTVYFDVKSDVKSEIKNYLEGLIKDIALHWTFCLNCTRCHTRTLSDKYRDAELEETIPEIAIYYVKRRDQTCYRCGDNVLNVGPALGIFEGPISHSDFSRRCETYFPKKNWTYVGFTRNIQELKPKYKKEKEESSQVKKRKK